MRIGSRSPRPAGDRMIFVVETDDVVRSALQFILRDSNEIGTFASLDEALSKTSDGQPDAVLLGLSLVRNDGGRFFAQLATRLPDVRVLLVADSATDPLALDWIGRGAHDVLGKPITVDAVRRKVNLLLGWEPMPTRTPAQLVNAVP